MDERFFLSLFNRAETWLAVTLLAGLFAVLLFRPQQIASPALFRLSYLLLAAYVAVPSLTEMMALISSDGGAPFRGRIHDPLVAPLLPLTSVFGRFAFAASLLCAFASLRIGAPPPRPDAYRGELPPPREP